MNRSFVVLTCALGLTACSGVKVEGKVVDGRGGQPVGGFTIKASATSDSASITCQFFSSEVTEDGSYSFPDLCGGTPYKLESMRDDLWLADINEIPDGGFAGPTELKVWNVPKGSGVWRIPAGGGDLDALKTAADIKQESIKGSEEVVKYPANVPKRVALIGADEHLLIVGDPGKLEFFPLIREPLERKFGDADTTVTMQPWWYVGKKFSDDKTFEKLEAKLDMGKVEDKSDESRAARYIAGNALPPGRYAAYKADDRRMFIVDFGAAPEPAKKPE